MAFGLYLHFPFCRNHCSYCDFYKESYKFEQERAYFEALRIETDLAVEDLAGGDYEISTIYVGGGTPSMASLDLFGKWLEQIHQMLVIPAGIEFSFECNPESVSRDMLRTIKKLGVNRPVFGVQSFNKRLLKTLGRKHKIEDTHRAFYFARALGYQNFGTDVIFGLPGQTLRMLNRDLDHIIELEPPHLSFYQLTVEEGTPLAAQVDSGKVRMPTDEDSAAMYQGGIERLREAGYERYEVSSLAQPGYECRHNIAYWEGNDYIGLGPAAHSFVNGQRMSNVSNLQKYMESLHAGDRPLEIDDSGIEERITESIMLGLRMSKGIDRSAFESRFGKPVEDCIEGDVVKELKENELLEESDTHVYLTDDGILLADEIIRRLSS